MDKKTEIITTTVEGSYTHLKHFVKYILYSLSLL